MSSALRQRTAASQKGKTGKRKAEDDYVSMFNKRTRQMNVSGLLNKLTTKKEESGLVSFNDMKRSIGMNLSDLRSKTTFMQRPFQSLFKFIRDFNEKLIPDGVSPPLISNLFFQITKSYSNIFEGSDASYDYISYTGALEKVSLNSKTIQNALKESMAENNLTALDVPTLLNDFETMYRRTKQSYTQTKDPSSADGCLSNTLCGALTLAECDSDLVNYLTRDEYLMRISKLIYQAQHPNSEVNAMFKSKNGEMGIAKTGLNSLKQSIIKASMGLMAKCLIFEFSASVNEFIMESIGSIEKMYKANHVDFILLANYYKQDVSYRPLVLPVSFIPFTYELGISAVTFKVGTPTKVLNYIRCLNTHREKFDETDETTLWKTSSTFCANQETFSIVTPRRQKHVIKPHMVNVDRFVNSGEVKMRVSRLIGITEDISNSERKRADDKLSNSGVKMTSDKLSAITVKRDKELEQEFDNFKKLAKKELTVLGDANAIRDQSTKYLSFSKGGLKIRFPFEPLIKMKFKTYDELNRYNESAKDETTVEKQISKEELIHVFADIGTGGVITNLGVIGNELYPTTTNVLVQAENVNAMTP